MTLILASASPRRRELLSRIVRGFVVEPSSVEESADGPPMERVLTAARAKCEAVSRRRSGVVIAADTIVVIDGGVLGKPESREHAASMIRQLSGRTHDVITGLHVMSTETGAQRAACERTTVHFRRLTVEEIEWYLDTEEYRDKAGAYAIQGRAALFVDWLHGDYYNVMGLPLCRLGLLLREIGVRLQSGM